MTTRVERAAALTVGTVETVAPDRITVVLDIEAPQATALNAGTPTRFPRINGFVLMPNEAGSVVGLVTWLGVERSAYPKRSGLRDFGLVDLPFPLRKLALTPIGTLTSAGIGASRALRLDRGVSTFPSVGDPVQLPTPEELDSLVESGDAAARIELGNPLLSPRARVLVDPDKVFGRHLAVLGNTGSGKSCSVAGLIRWSLETASDAAGNAPVNARFIVLDPNGEYASAFADMEGRVRIFQASADLAGARPLEVPAWMWNTHEWASFSAAGIRAQRPVLQQALRDLRAGQDLTEEPGGNIARHLRGYRLLFQGLLNEGPAGFGRMPGNKNAGQWLEGVRELLSAHDPDVVPAAKTAADDLDTLAEGIISERKERHPFWGSFNAPELESVVSAIDDVLNALPAPVSVSGGLDDAPIRFPVGELPGHLEHLVTTPGFEESARWIGNLTMRINSMLRDTRLAPIINPDSDIEFDAWLADMIGAPGATTGEIAVIDLSLVPADVIEVVIAVVARITFEALQRYRRRTGKELPTVLVLEEAHTFVSRYVDRETDFATSAQVCRATFERIAREGRKFGLGLVVSSQRPSELSETVLAQCNTFLLHRIVNDRDQALVSRLVPDNLGGVLDELPSFPARYAVLLGWATPVPVLLQVRELDRAHQPRSSDPSFWAVWTGAEKRPLDWTQLTREWVAGPGDAGVKDSGDKPADGN
jgi:DNA helicase HerA-like ATPase